MKVQFYTILKEEFWKCFDYWKTCWNNCFAYQEDYFEEN